MAHEIAHVAARHSIEQTSKGQLVNWASLPLIFMGGWGGFAVQQAAGLAIPMGFLKFGRNAEYEADMLGAQYLWATGYDPHAMSSFFEKLQAQEKKKPGTMARLFSTHPMPSDRIQRINALIVRFPERSEYTMTTSEFQRIKGRLISFSNARGTGGRGGASEADSKRPTLKKRQPTGPEGADPSATGDDQKAPAERPTLRKKDGEPTTESSSKPTKN
jgi:predicted Zn-dependent protease